MNDDVGPYVKSHVYVLFLNLSGACPLHMLSLSVAIMFVSYALQVRFRPYAASDVTNDLDSVALTPGMRLAYVRMMWCAVWRMLSVVCCQSSATRKTTHLHFAAL